MNQIEAFIDERNVSEILACARPVLTGLGVELYATPISMPVEGIFELTQKRLHLSFYRKLAIYMLLYWDGDCDELDNIIFLLHRDEKVSSKGFGLFRQNNQNEIRLLRQISELTIETEFRSHDFRARVNELNRDDLIVLCCDVNNQLITQESLYKNLIKSQWGI
jgi:hypothetical protein